MQFESELVVKGGPVFTPAGTRLSHCTPPGAPDQAVRGSSEQDRIWSDRRLHPCRQYWGLAKDHRVLVRTGADHNHG
jgi:hypothetical protein